MQIIDCFNYFDEDLILDIRLATLSNYVDKFIICEATLDHAGNKKKLNFDIKKFKKVINKLDKITRNILDEIIDKNNKSITSKNFDITKAYVYDDYPKPKDPFFEKNFQIY